MNLAEDYASRFKVESLGVYDALKDVWRHQNNTSDFATPSNVRVWIVASPVYIYCKVPVV